MRIVFDARPVHRRMHGIARHAVEILKAVSRIDSENIWTVLALEEGMEFLPELPSNFEFFFVNVRPYTPFEHILIPYILRKIEYDIFYSPTYIFPLFIKGRVFMTIHDLIPLTFPEDYGFFKSLYYRKILSLCMRRAEKIFTVSKSTARDIERFFGEREKIVVIQNGVSEGFSAVKKERDEEVLKELFVSKPYIVFVGNERPHKNFLNTARAFEILKDRFPSLKLIAVGISESDALRITGKRIERILCKGDLPDEKISVLLRNAELAVMPSFYEGFCLPVLEAMACGCPVITSNTSSLPEVLGSAGIMVNPSNPSEIASAIVSLLMDDERRKILREEGLKRAKEFSWEKTASFILNQLSSKPSPSPSQDNFPLHRR
jgi:glycosyltransferase involved in cell wall biosynthesis